MNQMKVSQIKLLLNVTVVPPRECHTDSASTRRGKHKHLDWHMGKSWSTSKTTCLAPLFACPHTPIQ